MRNEDQYKIDLEICPMPVLLVSSTGEIMRTNRRLNDLFGFAHKELVGQQIEVLVPEEVRDHHPDLRDAFFEVPTRRGMGTGRDLYGVRKDGHTIPVEIGLDPVEFHGSVMVMVSVVDIRERKSNEAMIRRALDAASSAMIQVSDSGLIELVNSRANDLFGYPAGELIGQPIESLVPDRYRRRHRVYRASYENDRTTRSMGRGRDLFGIRKNGTEFPIEIGLTPVEGMDHLSTMATIIDISDRRRREQHIARKNAELRRLNEELLQFAYSASHDLKAPLASIVGLLTCCEKDLTAGDVEEATANIGRSKMLADRLAKRIEDMLLLAKSDMVDATWEDIDIASRVEQIWSTLDHYGVTLVTDFRHTAPLRTIGARLDVVLENLISNAIKYREESAEENIVKVETSDGPEAFHLSVEDNGIGIPEEYRDRIFNLFQRVADSHQPGSGLGLALTKKNVTHLHGAIALESRPGKTVFAVTLPQGRSLTQKDRETA